MDKKVQKWKETIHLPDFFRQFSRKRGNGSGTMWLYFLGLLEKRLKTRRDETKQYMCQIFF